MTKKTTKTRTTKTPEAPTSDAFCEGLEVARLTMTLPPDIRRAVRDMVAGLADLRKRAAR
jgi:hypothetical protein